MSVVEPPDSPARNTRSRTRARSESQDNATSSRGTSSATPSTTTATSATSPSPSPATTPSPSTSHLYRVLAGCMVLTNLHQLLVFVLPFAAPGPLKQWDAPIPRIAAGACFVYWAIAESVFRTKKGKNQIVGSSSPQDRGSSLRTGLALIALQNLPLILLWIQGTGDNMHPLPGSFKQFHTHIKWYGIPLLMTHVALLLRWLSISTLGDFFSRSLTVFEEHRIVDIGIYSIIRHPGYLANLLLMVGSNLVISGNPTILVVVISVYFWVWHYRISVEEEMLLNAKKQAYQDYQTRVPYRLIPGLY